jgi:hypothetical protein
MDFHESDMLQTERNMSGPNITPAADVAAHVPDVHGSAVIQHGNGTITVIGTKT